MDTCVVFVHQEDPLLCLDVTKALLAEASDPSTSDVGK
jgi:hypothetical protein